MSPLARRLALRMPTSCFRAQPARFPAPWTRQSRRIIHLTSTFSQYESEFPFLSSSTPDWAAESVSKIVAARASPKFGNAPVTMSERDALGMFAAERHFRIPAQRLKHTFY